MPAPRRNTKSLSAFEGGYVLPNGKRLTKEIADEIGRGVGLDMTPKPIEQRENRAIDMGDGIGYAERNPFYTAYIDENDPLPPMLQIFSSCVVTDVLEFGRMSSRYTINLKTLKPTKASPIQTPLSDEILRQLR